MRNTISVIAAALALSVLAPNPAIAQIGPGPVGSRIDVSFNAVTLKTVQLDSDDYPKSAGGGLFTVHFTPKHGLQMTTDVSSWQSGTASKRMVAYAVEYRTTFPAARRVRFFTTIGVLGFYRRETREPGPTVTPAGVPIVGQNRTTTAFIPPLVPKGSIGVEYFLTGRVGVRAEAGFVGIIAVGQLRAAAGIVVAAGRQHVPRITR